MHKFLSKHQYGFREEYNASYCLLNMLKKRQSATDKGKSFGSLLTDLSKVFNYLSHDNSLTKFHAYEFSSSTLKIIHSYLTNRIQRTKMYSTYRSCDEIFFGVPQGPLLRPLLFYIFMYDLLFPMNERTFASYTADNTPFVTCESIEVIKSFENDSIKLFKWFADNEM